MICWIRPTRSRENNIERLTNIQKARKLWERSRPLEAVTSVLLHSGCLCLPQSDSFLFYFSCTTAPEPLVVWAMAKRKRKDAICFNTLIHHLWFYLDKQSMLPSLKNPQMGPQFFFLSALFCKQGCQRHKQRLSGHEGLFINTFLTLLQMTCDSCVILVKVMT